MKLMKTLSAGVAAVAITTAFSTVVAPTPVHAQQTTSDVRGVVTDEAGSPISGASITVVDTLTGTTRRTSTDGQGRFALQNLSATGNYSVTATGAGFQGEAVEGVRLSLGDTTTLSFSLARASAGSDEIVVVATRSAVGEVALGPNATFDFDDLQSTPAVSRDIKDIIRADPRLFIEESNGNGLQCAGASPRFNSLTVDGIKLNDNFGLNANGYPTERLPFPFDAINQVAVELAPFDVEYGGFTGCNINAVTRSGSNEFHGTGWFDYTNDSLNGGSIEGSSFDKGDFSNFRFGATLSGPIIKDKLFFFAAYEKINETNIIGRGPAEAGAIGVQGVSQAQLDRIVDIAQTLYGYTPTPLPSSVGEDDEKILAKLDWNINDFHRASFTFNRNTGNNLTASDDDPDEYEFFDHYYNRSTKLTSYSGQIFSSWSDNFSTEARVSYTTNDTRQESVGGTDFGEVRIRTFNNGEGANVYLGADDSRHSNKLDTKTLNMKFKADYQMGNNLFTVGFERETVDIFNLFIQHTEGEYRFDSEFFPTMDENIDAFEMGLVDDIYYGNAGGTNNPDDGAASFKFATNTLYVQDEVDFDEIGLSFTAGFRWDFYGSKDFPALNNNFVARNGYANTETFDGKGLLQPRFGFNWEATDNLTIRGGGGLFSGGNPNVWLSNSYQNDGITTIQVSDRDTTLGAFTFIEDEGGMGRPFWGVPESFYNDVAGGTANVGVNAIDPNFKVPSQWKAALGATYVFGDNYNLMVDFIYTDDKDAAGIVDATLEPVGTAPDGRPIYTSIDRSDPDCVDPLSAMCDDRAFNQDFILTNNDGGKQKVFSAALSKDYEFGAARANWTLAYAYTDAKDRNPMTSSVAFSNFVNFSTSDPNNPGLANSNYEVPHRFTVRAGVDFPIFSDYYTSIDLFGVISQSRPYSFNFVGGGDLFGDGLDDRHLFYVPTGPMDPNVIFDAGFDTTAFFAMINDLGLDEYAGQIAPRNGFQSDWFSQWDLRIEQELPGVLGGHKTKAFVVLDNIGNLINDEWGVINQAGFPGSVELVELDESGLGPNGEYIFTDFETVTPESIQSPVTRASVWQIRVGVKYEF
ncbi:TonB-dependent receptor [Hyphococcus sp.]|uniref:TonB-dependent receptor n=1 Tax=Hyphococcus sp. TaxID=2038636 RepID=UPI0035C72113